MGKRAAVATTLSRAAKPLGLRVEEEVSWDRTFDQWIADAQRRGEDPNDIGDRDWGTDRLDIGLQRHYLPHVRSDSVIVEMGPGTGRLSRHLVGRCGRLVLVERSESAVNWLRSYLDGKGNFEAHQIDGPSFPVADASADAVFAHGVVEHLPTEELYWYLREMARVLSPGGVAAFNFNDLSSEDGGEWIAARYEPLARTSFRLHMPQTTERLADLAGFADTRIFPTDSRVSFAELTT